MKKLNLLLGVLIGLTILSCSSDDGNPSNSDDGNPSNISKMIEERYVFFDYDLGVAVDDAILTRSTEYVLDNNKKITSFISSAVINGVLVPVSNGNIIYSNDRISKVEIFENNQLITKNNYSLLDK